MSKKRPDLTRGNITLQLLQFGMPIVISMILQNLYNVADTFIVGRYVGENAIAAVGNTTSVSQFVLLLLGGATTGMGVIVSQYFGAGEDQQKNVKKAIMTSLYIIVVLALILGALGAAFSRPLLKNLMGVPDTILEDSTQYIRIIFLGTIATAMYNMAFGVSKALGDSMTPMLILAFTCASNVALNVLFVTQFHLGVAGVAYATVLATMVSAVICIVVLWKKQPIVHPEKETLFFDTEIAGQLVKIGIPSALLSATMAIGNMVTQRFINAFGATVIAAFTTANKVEMLIAYAPGGLTGAMQFFTGQNVGAGNYDRVKKGYHAMMKISLVYTCIAMFVMIVFGRNLVGLFTSEGGDMIRLGAQYLLISALGQIFLNFMYMAKSTLIGAGDAMASVYTGILEVTGRILCSVILGHFFGYIGVFMGPPVGWALAMTYACGRYASGKWMKKRLVE